MLIVGGGLIRAESLIAVVLFASTSHVNKNKPSEEDFKNRMFGEREAEFKRNITMCGFH